MNGFSLCAALMGLALTLVLVQVAPVRANETGLEVGYTLPDMALTVALCLLAEKLLPKGDPTN